MVMSLLTFITVSNLQSSKMIKINIEAVLQSKSYSPISGK